jgi:hypothetical protein
MSQAVLMVSLILSCIAITIVVTTGMELFFALLESGWRIFECWAERTARSIDQVYHSFRPQGRTINKGMIMGTIGLLLLFIAMIAFPKPTFISIAILLIISITILLMVGIVIAFYFTIILLSLIVWKWITANLLPPIFHWAALAVNNLLRPIFYWVAQFIYRQDREIAANPTTDPILLRKLSGSRDRITRKEVAGNPNTPTDVLWLLIKQYPYQVLENPLFLLIVLENPNWIMEIPESDLHQLLHQPSLPEMIVNAAMQHNQSDVRNAAICVAAANPNTSAHRLEEITLNEGVLHGAVVQNPKITEESLQRFATCNNGNIQEQLAYFCFQGESFFSPSLSVKPQDILQWTFQDLIARQQDAVIFSLITHQYLPPQFIPQLLAALPHKLHVRLAKFSKTSADILSNLTYYSTYTNSMRTRICQAIARNRNTPAEILDEFADRPSKAIRISLALRREYSPELLVKLAIDPYREIRKNLLNNRYIKLSLLNTLRNHPRLEVREFVAAYINTPHISQ